MTKTTPTSPQIPLLTYFLLLFFLTFPPHGTSQSQPTPDNPELSILLRLKQNWSNPPSIDHWTPSTDHCRWPEITCTSGGSVTGLSLVDKNITTTIPNFICDLNNLTLLELQWNFIPGPFPTVLYNCTNLQHLNLSQNYFVGPIPSDVDRLSPHLRSLDVGGNNFTGDIPASIGRLGELRYLGLYQNLFNGTYPPEIGNLVNLEVLFMSFNNFLPSMLPLSFSQLKELKTFKMRHANLIGELPDTVGNFTAMEYLDLSENNFTGKIPNGYLLLKNLTVLYLYKNRLSGEIPQSVEALNLELIDLSENNLNGSIPEDFGKLTKLSQLSLFFNQLSGEIPNGIGRFPALTDIRLFTNNLSGELPDELGRYSKLEYIEVSGNRLTGALPEYLCANGVLKGVAAFDNFLTSELPSSLGNCSTLVSVRVERNWLSGDVPAGLWSSKNLVMLMLSHNSFTGQLPDKVATKLSRIEIHNNQFSGEIPSGISSLKNLTVFMASNNTFGGSIPQELTTLPYLETLLLDNNQLSGHLPSEIESWRSLTSLDLSGNELSGPIPAAIGFLPQLTYLDLSENQFSGEIPPQIGLLKLTSLNFSTNRLRGKIPVEFENAVFSTSFLNNSGLCASSPLSLGLQFCPPGTGTQKSSKISSQLLATLLGIAAGLVVLALILTVFAMRVYRKRKQELDLIWKLTPFQRLNFSESNILTGLTDNNEIGSGGSGKIYRVPVTRSGECVAVKKIWNNKKLDKNLEKEFLAEVEVLGTIVHSNIVKLLCCLSSETSKLLVYEYLENRSLDRWLHGKKKGSTVSSSVHHVVLDWPRRLQIAVDVARGLSYLHHDCSPSIIHRDVKSSNILLDSQFNAKIADFGLARMLVKHGELNTMSVVAGSFGYIAPEYAQTTRVNEKIDVYSFGVVLLELVTGREANNGDEYTSLADWAWRHVQEGNPIVDALDEEIKEQCYLEEMISVFKLGIVCTGKSPSTRPTMKDILQVLLRYIRPVAFGEKNGTNDQDFSPLLKNLKHDRTLERDDGEFASMV